MLAAAAPSGAQDASPADAPAASSPDDAALADLVWQLTDRKQDEQAAARLIEIADGGDERAILALQRIYDNAVRSHGGDEDTEPRGELLYLIEEVEDESGEDVGRVWPLFEPFKPGATPRIVPMDELSYYRAQRGARRMMKPVIAVLSLKSRDAAERERAAKRLGDTREADAIPALRKLAENDPATKVRRVARESVHLIVASGAAPDATKPQKLDAVEVLGELGSLRAYSMLSSAREALPAGDPAIPVYDTALSRIDRHRTVTSWINNTFFGLSLGSILVLMALGLAITFGLMGVINMAHGEMLMIGAVTTWACFEFISPLLPEQYASAYYLLAFPLSFLAAAGVGLLIECSIVRFLYKRPLDSLLATIGVSLILIQMVRLWKGDNLGMTTPAWLGGGWEVYPNVILNYNRLFILGLTALCLISVVVIFRFTRLGLMLRATVQNREMAQSLGVNTRIVDRFTFAYGAGLAGLAGYGIVLLTNPTPEMGQTYIVKSFLVTVVGGVGKLIGVVVSGLSLGFIEKFVEPLKIITEPTTIFDATWSQVFVLILVVLFMQRRPSGLFPDKGRLADQQTGESTPWLSGVKTSRLREIILGLVLVTIGLVVVPMLYAYGVIGTGDLQKYGQWAGFAVCAIGLDLLWGYMGVLSLCQFLFFSLGGYAMGLYLINHGPMDGINNDIPRALFVVMSDVQGATPPFFLAWFESFGGAVLLGLLIPGLVALLIGITTFSSRVRGVYFAILTQAITVGFWLVFQKNDLKLGGTNGLTNFTHILGYPIAQPDDTPWYLMTRFWLYIASVLTLIAVFALAKLIVHSRFGRVLVAIRDDETRLRFIGYQTWVYKAAIFAIAGVFAGVGGMLYVPQKGIITPHQIAAFASIMVVVWVALGGRGTLWGAVIGAILVSLLYDKMTSFAPDYWMLVLGGLFILVPLALPGGVMSLPRVIVGQVTRWSAPRPKPARPATPVIKEASA
jgi:urea transport system permease protein